MSKQTPKERTEDRIKRHAIQETWSLRLDNLPMSRRSFCDKYKLNDSVLCRYSRGKTLAGWLWINKVEAALRLELGE